MKLALTLALTLTLLAASAGASPSPQIDDSAVGTSGRAQNERILDPSSTGQSLFSDYSARVVIYTMAVTMLVVIMLGGAFVILNFGLLSRRREDRVGGRSPSDVAWLEQQLWPDETEGPPVLPAMEEGEELEPAEGAQVVETGGRPSAATPSTVTATAAAPPPAGPGAELGQPAPRGKDRGDSLEDASITSLGYSLRELRQAGHSTSVARDRSGVGREERESA